LRFKNLLTLLVAIAVRLHLLLSSFYGKLIKTSRMSIRFLHTGDLHLDTPFKGLTRSNKSLAMQLKEASVRSFRKIIDICIREQVDFLLVAGDIFDSENKSLSAQLQFVDELKRLAESGIHSYIIAGNHDPLNSWMKELKMPGKVHRFGSDMERIIHYRNGKPVADIYGVSFDKKEVTTNLAQKFVKEHSESPFSVVLLHGTLGKDTGHNPYAPFSFDDVRGKGFDYWALGHVHKKQILQAADPAVVYAGNPQGRDFGETGERGCYLVEMKSGIKPDIKFIPTHSVRFEEVRVDLAGLSDLNSFGEALTSPLKKFIEDDSTGFIFRLRLEGTTALHKHIALPGEKEKLITMLNNDLSSQNSICLIDDLIIATRPDADIEALRKGNDFTAEVLNLFEKLQQDENELDGLLKSILSNETKSIEIQRELAQLTPEEKQELLDNARWLLIDKLIKE
jgi:DNA repair protein SbcD/Mre11